MRMGDREGNLSIRSAAAIAGISPYTLRTWIRQRRLAHIRLGRRILLDPKDLEGFLAANRVPAKA